MRPGALFLVPLIAFALGLGLLKRNIHIQSSRTILAKKIVALMVILALSSGIAGGLQKIAFTHITNECGAIGGNQGDSIYGLSHGANWELARDHLRSKGIDRCESKTNPMLMTAGWQKLLSDPAPFFGKVIANAKSRALFIIRNKRQLALALLLLAPLISPRFRLRAIGIAFEERGLLSLLALSLAGCLACEIFVLLLLGEGGLRPIAPYAVFPILLFAVLLEIYSKTLNNLQGCKSPLLMQHDSQKISRTSSINRLGYVLLIVYLLSVCMAAGFALICWRPLQLSLKDTRKVNGSFSVVTSSWDSLVRDDWRFNALGEFYQLKLDVGEPADHSVLCLDYSRDRMPSSSPLGAIRAKEFGCVES